MSQANKRKIQKTSSLINISDEENNITDDNLKTLVVKLLKENDL